MKGIRTFFHHGVKCKVPAAVVVLIVVLLAFSSGRTGMAQTGKERGLLSGRVTADQGVVRGFRVKAKDMVHRITYTVYTLKGRYQFAELPPSSYEVRVLEMGLESPVEKVELRPGENKKVDFALKASNKPSPMEYVDYDTLYPPGPDRDVLMMTCGGCHGRTTFHRGRRTPDGWRKAVDHMTTLEPVGISNANGVPVLRHVPPEDKERIISYLTKNFGMDSKPRDLKLDDLVVDEDEVAHAVFVEYDALDIKPGAQPAPLVPTGGRTVPPNDGPRKRMLHDPYPTPDGYIWYADPVWNSMMRLDPREMDPQKRWREYPIAGPSVSLHGNVVDSKGHVYWAEIAGGSLGELDPKTGEMTRHKFPTGGAMLQVVVDSQDNVWYDLIHGSSIGKLDANTRKISQWEIPTPDANPYGLIVDKNDKVWAVDIAKHQVVQFDPVTEKFTLYPTPTQPSGPRRLGVNSKGIIWFAEYLGNALGMLDPKTGKIVEYKFPLRYTQGYEAWPDTEDNIWVSDNVYDSLIQFNPQTKKFTYYPLPQFRYNIPKIEIGKDGSIWFGSRGIENITAVNLRPNGNAAKVSSSASGFTRSYGSAF